MTVTVFTKPGCQQCNATYRALGKQGIEFNTVDVTVDLEAGERLRELGFQQLPVVETDHEDEALRIWTGFVPDNIKALAAA